MDANAALKAMIRQPDGHHKMATAFLAWLQDSNTDPLHGIAKKENLSISEEGSVLALTDAVGGAFYMAMLKDIASANELTDLITKAQANDQLPLIIVQYSEDATDTRGDNVFDMYWSTRAMSISHANRVYTRKNGN